MCGICGFIESEPLADNAGSLVVRMRDEMIHRGPDGFGDHVGKTYAFGHRRLSIVDLSEHGVQPMANTERNVWVTYNGEIYNHTDIRAQLESKGYKFHSHTDTEVLVHGWCEWGPKLADRLNGMFAFCIFDERTGDAFIARDRLGIKPFFYFLNKGVFAFASEIKSLLEHPACPRDVNFPVLAEHLLFRHVAGEQTLFAGIKQLMPGHHMTVTGDLKTKIQRYWSVREPLDTAPTDEEFINQFRESLHASVKRRMMSDVPLGTQLSGGLDSSVVTRFANDLTKHPIKTYSVGFKEKDYNEFPYSSQVADAVGTDHCPIPVTAADFHREFDKLVWFMDVPVDHPNSIFLHLLCKHAKQEVTVMLTGEGADEALCGYHRYAHFQSVYQRFIGVPGTARKIVAGLPNALQIGKLSTLAEWQRRGPIGMAIRNSAFGSDHLVGLMTTGHALDLSVRQSIIDRYAAFEPIEALLRMDQQVYLNSVLHRQDRVSMGASVEARVPMLDHTLVDMVGQWPIHTKLRNGHSKFVLKQAARDLVPMDIIQRAKMGFPVPIREWFRADGGLSPRLDLLTDSDSAVAQWFDNTGVKHMIDTHRNNTEDHAEDLWILLALESWHRTFLRGGVRKQNENRSLATVS